MKYIVAVSGGVDSVVLLDVLVKLDRYDLVVAHFDHGIRPDSAPDARFVEALAKQYGLPFFTKREKLGASASEELARTRRYEFLRQVADQQQATIITAHHQDDLVETIAINILRGTGWRGLAVLGAPDIHRPLLAMTKQAIYNYALQNRLEWVEDSTNASDKYLRNRLRRQIAGLPAPIKDQLAGLRRQQLILSPQVSEQSQSLVGSTTQVSRYLFIMIDQNVAEELLWQVVKTATGISLLRPQCARGVVAIRMARPTTRYQLGEGVMLAFTVKTFSIQQA